MQSSKKNYEIIIRPGRQLQGIFASLPSSIIAAGENASRKFIEFFTANIRNRNTRLAYARAVRRFFDWCEGHRIALDKIEPMLVAAYIEEVGQSLDVPSVKQHLAAIRMLFDYLVVGQVIKMNPAAAVRGPKHVATKGKTPVLAPEESARTLRLHRAYYHRRPARSGSHRRHGLQLRPRRRRRRHEH